MSIDKFSPFDNQVNNIADGAIERLSGNTLGFISDSN
jgi:hypothetical protein